MSKYKKRIFELIQIGNKNDILSRLFDVFIVLVIFLNITIMFLNTFDSLRPYAGVLGILEGITVFFFCVEYILRIWTADLLYPELSPGEAVLKFLVSFDGVIDLLTILPFFFLTGFVALRLLRVVRIFHLFRLNAQYDSFNVIKNVIYKKRNQIISSVFIIIILMLASSISIYSVEHPVQPDVYKNAFSGMWWSLSTIFTVGYGDIYPITLLGRGLAIIITFLGVGVVAIPTGIISAGFVEEYSKMQRNSALRKVKTSVIMVEREHEYIGMTVDEIEEAEDFDIIALVRDGNVSMPMGNIRLQINDTIIYQPNTKF